MSSILESIEWGKPALELVQQAWELDLNAPAFMHIRHSERPPVSAGLNLPLTDRGVKAAYEFGRNLPVDRKYYLYHTNIDRNQMTAENMQKGILDRKGVSKIMGEIPVATIIDAEENASLMMRAFEGKEEAGGARTHFYRWLSGLYPPWVRKPSLEFAQQGAFLMMKNLREAEPDDLHVWVSHETWIAAFLMHWLGEFSFDWISYMDGFILQFHEGYMMSFFRGEKKEVKYPYWWNF